MTKRRIIFLTVLWIALTGALLAQEATTPQFDPEVVDAIILTGVGGLGVAALTELIKRLLKAAGVLAYAISAVVSAGATALFLATSGSFEILSFVIYSILVFLSANGIYKFSAKSARNE